MTSIPFGSSACTQPPTIPPSACLTLDDLVHAILADPEHANAKLHMLLSPEFVTNVDLATIQLDPRSFVAYDVDDYQDLLYTVKRHHRPKHHACSVQGQAQDELAFIYLLLQHSTPRCRRHALSRSARLVGCISRIWEDYAEHQQVSADVLPLFEPVILVHTVHGWTLRAPRSERRHLVETVDLGEVLLSALEPCLGP